LPFVAEKPHAAAWKSLDLLKNCRKTSRIRGGFSNITSRKCVNSEAPA
jgi:hypothetical protein